MSKLTLCLCSLLIAIVSVAPLLAGEKDATDAKSTKDTKSATPAATNGNMLANPNVTALLGVLVMKGVLAPAEAKSIESAPPASEYQLLLDVLTKKGVVTAADLAPAPAPTEVSGASPAAVPVPAKTKTISVADAAPAPQVAVQKEAKPAGPTVVPAIAPLRVLPVDPPVKDGLKAAFNMGPVKMTPYGFLKATAVYDTSNPNGDDMPFPGLFLNNTTFATTTGPTQDPEFHLKARSSRIGANFEFGDLSSKLTLTGRIEADFEGNYSEVNNRDVSSVRSSMMSFRQAWARLDYAANENTDIYFEGGQDWTLFGSGALPNLLETTA